jgi:excisionase family DNA binding protein
VSDLTPLEAVQHVAAEYAEAIAQRAAEIAAEIVLDRLDVRRDPEPDFMTIPEAADLLRSKRKRVDDLLSAGRLTRHKDGSRTLVSRVELLGYLNGGGR